MTEEKTGKYEGGYDGSLMQIADNIEEIRDGLEFLMLATVTLAEAYPLGHESTDVPLKGISRISSLLLKDMDENLNRMRENHL